MQWDDLDIPEQWDILLAHLNNEGYKNITQLYPHVYLI